MKDRATRAGAEAGTDGSPGGSATDMAMPNIKETGFTFGTRRQDGARRRCWCGQDERWEEGEVGFSLTRRTGFHSPRTGWAWSEVVSISGRCSRAGRSSCSYDAGNESPAQTRHQYGIPLGSAGLTLAANRFIAPLSVELLAAKTLPGCDYFG